jgi:hypothetical protein
MRRLFPSLLTVSTILFIFFAPKESKRIVLEWFFLTLGPVEQVPSEPWHLPIINETEVLILSFIWLFLIVSVVIICKRISKELPHATPFERTFFFLIFLLLIINFKFPVTACDIRSGSPGIWFPSADPEIPPEPGMPQGAPGHEIQHPIPPPPEIPRLDQPLINDRERFIELQRRFNVYYLGRNRITDLAEFAGRLERAVPIERNIEAALVFDGYDPDRIRGRINEIREILFTHPTRVLLLSEQTLDRYLNEIETNGTRQSAPYMRVVRAIRNSNLIL